MKYLQSNGYKVYPVNPTIRGEKILGEKVYAKVSEIDGKVDIIDVFRPSNEAAEIAPIPEGGPQSITGWLGK